MQLYSGTPCILDRQEHSYEKNCGDNKVLSRAYEKEYIHPFTSKEENLESLNL